MRTKLLVPLLAGGMLMSGPATAGDKCVEAGPDGTVIEVPVKVRRAVVGGANGTYPNYRVALGERNEFADLCISGREAVIAFYLAGNRGDFAFQEISFDFPPGFQPTDSPFQLTVVAEDSLVVNYRGSEATDFVDFKYEIVLVDGVAGNVIVLDPRVTNTN